MTRRIDISEVAAIRNRIKAAQGNVCALCGKPFTKADYPVLDHDHHTGYIRGVLHNSCNKVEGKVRYKARSSHKGVSEYEYLIALGKYLELHSEPQVDLFHHEHILEHEKAEKRREYQRKYRAKKKAEREALKNKAKQKGNKGK